MISLSYFMIILNCAITGILLICVFLIVKVFFIFRGFLGCCNLRKICRTVGEFRCDTLIFELWPFSMSRVWLRKLSGTQPGQRLVGAPGRLIIWCPFKPIFYKVFRSRTGLAKLLEGACPNRG